MAHGQSESAICFERLPAIIGLKERVATNRNYGGKLDHFLMTKQDSLIDGRRVLAVME